MSERSADRQLVTRSAPSSSEEAACLSGAQIERLAVLHSLSGVVCLEDTADIKRGALSCNNDQGAAVEHSIIIIANREDRLT